MENVRLGRTFQIVDQSVMYSSSSISLPVSFETIAIVAAGPDDGAVVLKPRVAYCSDVCTVDTVDRKAAYRMRFR